MSAIATPAAQDTAWKPHEKIAFRFLSIFFLLQVIPLDLKFFRYLFTINWLHLQFPDIFNMAHYMPLFFANSPQYTDLGIFAVVAVTGAIIWTYLESRQHYDPDYDAWYYRLRVLLRYRLAIALLAYGIIKIFPVLSPFPSISNLNTPYGNFTDWKIFSLSLGIVPSYELFLGLVEVLAALLLLYRKTATIGAFIVVAFTGNVFLSNLAYNNGEGVYSFFLVLIALFLLAFDTPRLARLLAWGRPTAPNRYHPAFTTPLRRYGRLALKIFVVFFFGILHGMLVYAARQHNYYKYPETPGLSNASGLYNVSVFRINRQTLPYTDIDTVRWQDVVFEKWATLSVRSNRPVIIDTAKTERFAVADIARDYELEGAAGRHFYSYQADTVHKVLYLQNKNKHYHNEQWILHYERPNDSTIILAGVNQHKDSVYAELSRINKKYLLEKVAGKGRSRAIRL